MTEYSIPSEFGAEFVPASEAAPETVLRPEAEVLPEPEPEPEPVSVSVSVSDPVSEPEPEALFGTGGEPANDAERESAARADQPRGPLLPAVAGESSAGGRSEDQSPSRQVSGSPGAPAPEAAGRPRFGTVSVPEPSRTPPARRRDVPSVRVVRLTDEPPAGRPGPTGTPAAVTPVPLPVPRPVPRAVPTESRTEEPQP
ncbi:hypothetical protein ACFW2Y_26285 [Streptomyces sp. NPDC058877]|uniref:hypothetical protein n=1 Tax=Streptomyces sp. NPDC058877 TaxID=3346665 RepID=UPI0036AE8C81